MKKFASTLLKISAVALVTACNPGAPQSVTETFHKMFPEAKDVEWTQEDESTWEAEFEIESKEYSACFSSEGAWMETEFGVETDGMPYEVVASIDSTYAGFMIEESSWVETPDFIGYELELSKEGGEETEMEVLITPEGKIIREEVEKEDEGGDED